MGGIFLDGDFSSGKECKYHCSPTCHPGQIDENNWHYGCLHKAWPQNKEGDFCPFVECDGNPEKCEIPKKFIKNMLCGKRRKISNALRKIETTGKEINELEALLEKHTRIDAELSPEGNSKEAGK
jgi:hypothetical protein